jgi:molybdopterin-dependent oxidoreductase alpha subunit
MHLAEAPALLLRTNKPDGFDCPGCAWPDKEHTSTFQFCENGAKAVTWEATKKRAAPQFFAAHTVTELLRQSDYELEDHGRITHPMAYDPASDTYKPLEWDAAFARIGEVLRGLSDPDMAEFYTSGRASNEAAFLFNIFAREYGTNNFPDCSNMCHEATSVGLPQAIGIGKGTVSLEDFDHCGLIIAMGHNPGTNHPRMMGTLHECARRGVPIIVFNPLKERALERFADPQNPIEMASFSATPIASTYHQVKVGGDAAALKGIMKAIIARADAGEDVLDREFIAAHTNGFDAFAEDLRQTPWEAIETASGLTRSALDWVADAYIRSNATIVSYGMGITQHEKGTQNVQQIAALLLLRGNYGKPGAGICPLRGHSNVQGNRTVGITEKPNPVMFANVEKVFGFHPPPRHGHDAVKAMQAMVDGKAKVLVSLGGNFSIALPDPQLPRHAQPGPGGAPEYQAKPLAPADREGIRHPARPRQHGARHAGNRCTVDNCRGFDVDGPRLARQAGAGLRTPAFGARDHRRHRHGDAAFQQGRLAGANRRLRSDPRQDRSSLPGLQGLQCEDPPPGWLPVAARPYRAGLAHQIR